MSGDVRKIKKDKEIVVELESQIRDISLQFADQLKALDHRLDIFHGVVWEMQDFYRRRSEVQSEYARNLEKMSRQINLRHKDNKQKRESWVGYSTFQAWQGLVSKTKQTSKDQAAIGEILNNLSLRLGEVGEDMQRIYKKCRDVTIQCQADISKVLSDVLNAMKTYHLYHGESQVAENKLLRVQSQKVKVDQQSGGLARKFVNYEKKSEKKQAKYAENKLKALKARNEYLLCIDIANAAVGKFFGEDFPQMVRKMDAGYHLMVSQVLEMHATSQKIVNERDQGRVADLFERAQGVQGSSDYDLFCSQSQKIFQLPNKIEFQSHKGDEVTQISAQKPVLDDILVRLDQISIRLNKEKESKVESTKVYESNEKQFFEKLRCSPINLDQYFADDKPVASKSPTDKLKEDKIRFEDSFVEMYKDNLLRDNLIIRLQTKYDSLRKSLGDNEHIPINIRPPSLPPKPKRRNVEFKPGKEGTRPKLFGGSIEEYVEATGEAIPSIMRSCIRVINIYGMLHQGIFRVSGSMNEMMNYKQMFERGEDPLLEKMDGDDINTVAGLLKMYFRELKEPLFPSQHFDALIKCCEAMYPSSTNEGDKDWKSMLKDILSTFSPQRIVIMRYLFAFLSHVTANSDENMMEAYNLAICFGPTLIIPSPDRTDQHQYQGLINDLVKNIIIHYQDIFPPPTQEDVDNNAVYEKFLIDKDFLGSMSDDDGLKGALNEEDEDFEEREATVDENYEARGERELSCCRGDVVILLKRESNDFWNVEHQNKFGLLPDKILNTKRSLHSSLKKSHNLNRSTECLMSTEFINQSDTSLVKTPSNHNVSENGNSSAAPSQINNKYRSSNISLHSVSKNNVVSEHANVAAGLDSILAKVQMDINSLNPQHHVTTATTRYQQTLVPVLPPLPRPTLGGESQPPLKISSAAFKKRNASLTSELDVIVTPPSPSIDKSFPAPPTLSHDPVIGKLSSPLIGQNKSSAIKWNSLPHNIPAVGNNPPIPNSIPAPPITSSPAIQPSTTATNRIHSASPSVGTPTSSQAPHSSTQSTTIQSATLPRSSEKQSSAPPVVRAKPTLPKKRISGAPEDRNSISPEILPKVALSAQQPTAPLPLNTFGRPIKPVESSPGSTFLSGLDSNGERNQFSSFKISGIPKK